MIIKELYCVPIFLLPTEHLKISRCSILPGVKLVIFKGELKKKITSISENLPIEIDFSANYAVLIYLDEYITGVKLRIQEEGNTLSDKVLVKSIPITKQVIFSLILAGRITFKFGGTFCLKEKIKGRSKSFYSTGYNHEQTQESFMLMQYDSLPDRVNISPLTPKKIISYAKKLDRYYRLDFWGSDRFSMTLAYTWDAMCTPFVQQSYLGLSNALEALISTTSQEITHILAERIALLTETTPLKRKEVYDKIKGLYNIRSKITHGSAFIKKGRQTNESLIIHPQLSIVPREKMKDLINITMSVITHALAEDDLLSMIQAERNEDKIGKDINEYFAKKLFNL